MGFARGRAALREVRGRPEASRDMRGVGGCMGLRGATRCARERRGMMPGVVLR